MFLRSKIYALGICISLPILFAECRNKSKKVVTERVVVCNELKSSQRNRNKHNVKAEKFEINGLFFENISYRKLSETSSGSVQFSIENIELWYNRKSLTKASKLGFKNIESLVTILKTGFVDSGTSNIEAIALASIFRFGSIMNYRSTPETLLMTGIGPSYDMSIVLISLRTQSIIVLNPTEDQNKEDIVSAALILQDSFVSD
jgi:hypothetical protein